jgi:hypothetical protein
MQIKKTATAKHEATLVSYLFSLRAGLTSILVNYPGHGLLNPGFGK